jgi:hypothetical protein
MPIYPIYLERDAVLSDCGKYRYLLRRVWAREKPRALFVMLNPSTADASTDDPTIRSCVRLIAALGYGSIDVVNVFAYRATKPDELLLVDDPIGPRNMSIIESAISWCDPVILAWGAWEPAREQGQHVYRSVVSQRPLAYCFGETKNGAPRHPLYIKSRTPIRAYRPRVDA